MMYSQNKASQYRAVRSYGVVAAASPTRLVQLMYEHILTQLATAQGCMQRIRNNQPLSDVKIKLAAMRKAIQLVGQLNATLDMQRGGVISVNLRALYEYMLPRLTIANANNDAEMVAQVASLVRTIKQGWDQIVAEGR
jgi:flagellar protein FliS